MNELDRFFGIMHYEPVDRLPWMGEGPWPETTLRWQREGMPVGRSWDDILGVPTLGIAGHGFNGGLYPPETLEVLSEDEECIIKRDSYGRKVRTFKDHSSVPEVIEHPVKDRASFEAILERFEIHFEERLPSDWAVRVERWNRPDFNAILLPPAGSYFWTLNGLMGTELACLMFYDAPDLVHELFERLCEMSCRFLELAFKAAPGMRCIGTGEDFAFKNGPFFSPALFDEFFRRHYLRASTIARRAGAVLFYVDSDGNFTDLIPKMLEVGMNLYCPLEVAAGMDPVALRRRFGRELRVIGGVDKRIVAAGPEAIDREMKRLLPMMREGGFAPKIDHSISPDISWDHFRYYIDALRRIHADWGS